jgi:carlactone synthase/all-trans-10'-apo-beta-carotenal 13,14-cleaving dioxygenase
MMLAASRAAALVAPPPPPAARRRRGAAARPPAAAAQPSAAPSSTSDASTAAAAAKWPSAAARAASFAAPAAERAGPAPAPVAGRLPPWLSGAYLRNGPGSFDNGSPEGFRHLFDGYAMILKVELDGAANAASAAHAFVESDAWRARRAAGAQRWREFATPPPGRSLFERAADVAEMSLGALGLARGVTDNASVAVLPQRGGARAWAVTETVAGTLALDVATLRTLGRVVYSDALPGQLTTAHPKSLPNGDLLNITTTPGVGYSLYRQAPAPDAPDAPAERVLIARVPARRPLGPAWIHDFPASAHHAVIPEMPLSFDLLSLMSGVDADHLFMRWRPEEGVRLHVVDIKDGSRRVFDLPEPFFCFHWANAFESEDGRYLYLDGALFEDAAIVDHLALATLKQGPGGAALPPSALSRVTLDLAAPEGAPGAARVAPLWRDAGAAAGRFAEFPTVAPAARGRRHRYVWHTSAARPTNYGNALAKTDTASGEVVALWHEPGGVVGEPWFVPAPAGAKGGGAEDAGALLAVVTQADGGSALLVLDGEAHEEVARVALPPAPGGFHGAWIPKEDSG